MNTDKHGLSAYTEVFSLAAHFISCADQPAVFTARAERRALPALGGRLISVGVHPCPSVSICG